jgi:hypothetical protein
MKKEPSLTELQFQLLDSIYFPEPLDRIVEEAGEPLPIVIAELKTLIDRGWVQVMHFDELKQDFVRANLYDADHMEDYHFLVTKDGLLRHNGH